MNKTPIVVFTYNRPEHTRNLLDSLAACIRLTECDIFIYSDAPRIPEHAGGVEETRTLIQAWGAARGAQIIQHSENRGLARSIVGGVTELCQRYGRVIVVEDDLVLHPNFIHYMLSALDHYQNEEKVVQVSGYMFPAQHPDKPDAFLLPLTTTWGWGTWQRAWKNVDWQAENALSLLSDKKTSAKFDLDNAYPYAKMLQDRLQGKNQSWGILFYWWVFANGLLVLHPCRTFVYNFGMDGSGYHASGRVNDYGLEEKFAAPQNIKSFEFPVQTDVNWQAYRRIKRYVASLKFQPPYKSIRQMLKHRFGKRV